MRIGRTLLALAIILGLLAAPALRVGAEPLSQQPGLGIAVQAGFGDDSSYVLNEWFPVRVLLTNPAGASSARVRVEVDSLGQNSGSAGAYAREVDLPSPSRKEVTLYAYGSNFDKTFTVRVAQGDAVIGSKSVTVNPLEQGSDTIIGVLSSDASLLNVLRGEHVGHIPAYFNNPNNFYGGPPSGPPPLSARVTVSHITAQDVPTLSAALNGLAAIVLDDVDTGPLTQEQQEALIGWIARGGTLIVAARPGGSDLSPEIARLLPVKIGGTRTLNSLQGLGDLVAVSITPTSPVLVTDATLLTAPTDRATLLASQDGAPLVAMRDVGEGHIAYLALSPGLPPLKTWDGLTPLFKRLMAEYKIGSTSSSIGVSTGSYNYRYSSGLGGTAWGMYSSNSGVYSTEGGLFDLPVLDLPDPLGIGIFLLIYVLLIGPINFIILRRMRRAELAWITIPVMVLIFSVGAYLIGYQSKGGDLIMIRANVAHSAPGAQDAAARQFTGVFSPRRSNFRVTVGADSAASELNRDDNGGGSSASNPIRVVGGSSGTTTLDNVSINTSSLRSFVSEDSVKADPPLESDLHLADNLIVGTVHNRTNGDLQDVALVRGNAVQYIGYMPAGGAAQVKLVVSTQAFNNSSPISILPAPAGVFVSNSSYNSGGPVYYGNSPASAEQRKYNRKINVLNVALAPLLSYESPTDMDVLAITWGANAPVGVNVEGHIARTEDVSLWTSRLPVVAGASDKPSLKAGAVPFWTYLPTADPAWYSRFPSAVTLDPYADMRFQLPAGTKPEHLSLVTSWPLPDGVDLLAYNLQTGQWDRLIGSDNGTQPSTVSLSLPNPKDYTGPSGNVTIRLLSKSGKTNVQLSTFYMALN